MDCHERIMKIFDHEEPDRVPTFTQSIEPEFIKDYVKEGYPLRHISRYAKHIQVGYHMGFDSKWVHCGGPSLRGSPPELPPDLKKKFKGKRINRSGHVREHSSDGRSWYIDGALKTAGIINEWATYVRSASPPLEIAYKRFKKLWDKGIKKGMLLIPTIGSPFYTSWASIGMNRLGYIFRKYPQAFHNLMSAWTDKTIEAQTLMFERDVNLVMICDDHAQKNRSMISNKQFEEFVYPYYKKMADNAHKHGAKFILHTDGNYIEEFPLLIKAGVDACEPLEYEAGFRLKELKEKYGDDMVFIGNVPSSDALSVGSVEDTIRITKECIRDAAEGGGLILGTSANILGSCKVKNVQAYIDTVKKYGQYPIDYSKL